MMADRQKVIKGLECCISSPLSCKRCPYDENSECSRDGFCHSRAMEDALLLLKEEAAEVVEEERRVLWDETDDGPVYTHDVFYHCPSCNLILSRTHKDKDINFCENCGQAVKWNV